MDDIARGAGISRPAHYLVFPNKEVVFRDLVESGLNDILDRIETGLAGRTTLSDELQHVFQASSVASLAT